MSCSSLFCFSPFGFMVPVYLIPSHASKKICYNFSYVLYLARIVLVRWDGLREPVRGLTLVNGGGVAGDRVKL